jgi:hypothetical protein
MSCIEHPYFLNSNILPALNGSAYSINLPEKKVIPVKISPIYRLISYRQLVFALLAGLALRLFFISHFSSYAGDSQFYKEIARNWLDHGVYGRFFQRRLTPVDMRMPGYPAFLAAVYTVFGRADKAVMLVQAFFDLMTCILVALIAARFAPAHNKAIVATVALWLAALCPFTANYTSVVLTEVLATFLTTLAIFVFVCVLDHPSTALSLRSLDRRSMLSAVGWFLLAGALVGMGTLVRPEMPLLLAAMVFVLCIRWWRRINWPKLALTTALMTVGLLLPLMPWAVRNARTMGRIEFLAPRYAETQNDFIPRGFYQWTGTWMVQSRDAYLAPWKLGNAPIPIETLPGSAFDSAEERIRIQALLSRYNSDLKMTPQLDQEFGLLARERTARHPVRTYFTIPVVRALMIWFTPRIELLPYSGKVWPLDEKWRANPIDFGATLGLGFLNFIYVGLALVGAWRCRRHPALALLIAFVVLRTALLTQLHTIEPRYVVMCFPVLLALGAQAWGSVTSPSPALGARDQFDQTWIPAESNTCATPVRLSSRVHAL